MLERGSERRWLAAFVLTTLLIVEIPYLVAVAQSVNGWVFAGMIWSPHDYAQYASAMRQGAASDGWLIHDLLSHEPHNPAFIYVLYVLLGKVAAITGLDISLVFHLAEILGRLVLLLALYAGTRLLFQETSRRRLALIVTVFTSGLGAWMLGVAICFHLPLQWSIFTAADLSVPELNTFLVLFTAPHLMLGLAAIVLWATGFCQVLERPAARPLVQVLVCTAVVGMTNPFSLVTIGLIACVHIALRWVAHRRIDRASVLVLLIMAMTAGPLLAYNVFVFSRDPFWGATYGAQNALTSPPVASLLLSYGALLIFALMGAPTLFRDRSEGARLVLIWVVLITLLMYAPVNFQRRFGFGLHPMLALAATVGIEIALARKRRVAQPSLPWQWRLARSSAALGLLGTTIVFYLLMVRVAAMPTDDIRVSGAFHRAPVQAAATWLSQHSGPDDLTLAETHTANFIGGWQLGRVYSAHWVATADFADKLSQTNQFYATNDVEARDELLTELGVRYVVYGRRERALGGAPPTESMLHEVFESGDLVIYEVGSPVNAATGDASVR